MDERILALAVPAFFVLIAVELVISWRTGRRLYRLHDTISNLGCGVGMVATSLFLNLAVAATYGVVLEHLAFFRLPADHPGTWAAGLVLLDLCHYWFHRASHRINFFWAAHAVHHQSDEYNLSAALRQSWLEPLWSLPFYLPLALLGLPVQVFLALHAVHTIYQFWIHTRVVGKLGPLEYVFNTPSHHRVHHAIEPEYIDKNYAGLLILWDRLFGTFEPEGREPHYGTVKPLQSWNPLWANIHEWARIAAYAVAARSASERLWAPLAPPEWRPASLGGVATVPEVSAARKKPWDTRVDWPRDLYVIVHFVAVTAGASALMVVGPSLAAWRVGLGVAWVVGSLASLGGLMEDAPWARRSEDARVVATVSAAALVAGLPGAGAAVAFALLARVFWDGRGLCLSGQRNAGHVGVDLFEFLRGEKPFFAHLAQGLHHALGRLC